MSVKNIYQASDGSFLVTAEFRFSRFLVGIAATATQYSLATKARIVTFHLGPFCLMFSSFITDEATADDIAREQAKRGRLPRGMSPTRRYAKNGKGRRKSR